MSLFLTFAEISLAQVIEETNINVGISIQKSYFLLFDGSTISYNFQIYNPNNYTIENLDLQFELRSTDAGRIFLQLDLIK